MLPDHLGPQVARDPRGDDGALGHDHVLVGESLREISDIEPRVTGNHGTTKRQEKAAIKKVVASSRFVLPVHDRPALIEAGQVVGRLQDAVPGPVVQSLPRRNWFPA